MSSADSALRRLGPSLFSLGLPQLLPRWDVPCHLPAPPAPSGGGGFCSIIRGPRRGVIAAGNLLFKGSFARPVQWNPISRTLSPPSLPQLQAWREGGHIGGIGGFSAIVGQVDSWAGAGRLSIHNLLPGVGLGVRQARRESVPVGCNGVLRLVLHVFVCPQPRGAYQISVRVQQGVCAPESPGSGAGRFPACRAMQRQPPWSSKRL